MKNNKSVAIIGLGLIGGSLAKVLKKKGYKVIGIDKNKKSLILALQKVEVVFIATPLSEITKYIKLIFKLAKKNQKLIVTDVGSTKSEICDYAAKHTARRSLQLFIGGHPMAGSEKTGFKYSDESLFKNRKWVLTPTNKNHETRSALITLKKIINDTGAKVILASPNEHDKAVALISHFPLIASLALCNLVRNIKDKQLRELAENLASSGFRDVTRIAGGNPEMNSNMIFSNKEELKTLHKQYKVIFKKLFTDMSNKNKLKNYLSEITAWRNNMMS